MLKGLSRAGIGDIKDIKQFIQLASEYKFEAIETDGKSLWDLMEVEGLDNTKALLNHNNIQICAIGLQVEWRKTEEEFRGGLNRLIRDAEVAASLGCTSSTTYILPSTDQNAAHFMALAISRLRTCAQILGAFGIRLGLEFVGPHHLRTAWENPFIWNMKETVDLIAAIDEKNVGLLIDSYHWYTNELCIEDILQLDNSQIVHVHINDAPNVPITEVLDNDRLYPGEGVIDLVGFLKALKRIGYKGAVSQEILTLQPQREPADTLVKKSADAFDGLFTSAGLEQI
ncbi:sugar phosphate isomerase/epimerase family protein [Metabacillus dongyingensis]|uniref:sugar phosphate isomerase/epimerase family protein n=1 Tax=Metabacillus dongyingensis TaxID=2874282 RepID=UPI003B8AAF45